jgi:hypothetical protein
MGRNKRRKYSDPEIERLREALGPAASHYNDAQLRALSDELDRMAELLLELWAEKAERQKSE